MPHTQNYTLRKFQGDKRPKEKSYRRSYEIWKSGRVWQGAWKSMKIHHRLTRRLKKYENLANFEKEINPPPCSLNQPSLLVLFSSQEDSRQFYLFFSPRKASNTGEYSTPNSGEPYSLGAGNENWYQVPPWHQGIVGVKESSTRSSHFLFPWLCNCNLDPDILPDWLACPLDPWTTKGHFLKRIRWSTYWAEFKSWCVCT